MAVLKYLKLKDNHLPKADSSLSEQIPKSSLLAANKEVRKAIDCMKDRRRGAYTKNTHQK